MNARPVLWGVLVGWMITFLFGAITWAATRLNNEIHIQPPYFASTPIGPNAPIEITLSNTSVPENQAIGHPVGSFATAGLNPTGTYTYTLVSGAGDADNASFYILTDTLHTNTVFNYQVKNQYNILVQANGGVTATATQGFTITVANLAPVDISLSNNTITETYPIHTRVGEFTTIDPAPAKVYTYTLVNGTGDVDNPSFTIAGNVLFSNAVFQYFVKNSYSIRVQTDDGSGGIFQKLFTISVLNLPPVDISLSNNTIIESLPIHTQVGKFTTIDPAPARVYTYTLVSGTGDMDNASFSILTDTLRTNAVFQYSAKKSYSIRVQTDDGSGGTFQKPFTISVLDLPPTDISLSNLGITKNTPIIGAFSTTDASVGDAHTYSLVSGLGDGDNAYFVVVSNTLATKPGFNYRLKSNFNIRVRSTDSGGLYVEKPFSLYSINQVPKALNDSYAMRTGATLSITVTGALNNSCPATQAPNVTDVITETGVLNNDCDPDQDMLTAVRDSLPLHANNFNLHPDGTFTYTPAKGFVGTDSFSYHATDGLANSNTAEVEITVLDLESPKVFWQTPVINGEVFVASNNLQEIIPLSVDATDNIAVDHVRFYRWDAINNKYLDIVNVSSPPYQAELAVKTLNAGWNQIFVKAEDSSGNWSNRAWIWVLVNRAFLPTAIH